MAHEVGSSTPAPPLDCLVIGAGPGGLMSAMYLARFRRNCAVVDAGGSRLHMIARTRNVLGFPDGVAGSELLETVRGHAGRFGVAVTPARVTSLQALAQGGFEARSEHQQWHARTVVLATGAVDVQPEVENLEQGLAQALVRYCPVCDGFESQDKRVAVLGRWEHGLHEAEFVAGFGNDVTWLSMQTGDAMEPAEIERLQRLGVRIADGPPRRIRCLAGEPGQVEVELAQGGPLRFDLMYSALGLNHASQLATEIGARTLENGQLEIDAHLQTSIPGLYAVGDVAGGLNQINVAAGHAAIAATAIHNAL